MAGLSQAAWEMVRHCRLGRPCWLFFSQVHFRYGNKRSSSSSSLRKVESITGGMFGGEHCDKFVPSFSSSSSSLFIIPFLFIIIEFIPKTTGDGRTSRITMTGQSRPGFLVLLQVHFHFLFCIASCRLPVSS